MLLLCAVSPALASSSGVVFSVWFGAILCAAAVGSVFILTPIDKAMDLRLKEQSNKALLSEGVEKVFSFDNAY